MHAKRANYFDFSINFLTKKKKKKRGVIGYGLEKKGVGLV